MTIGSLGTDVMLNNKHMTIMMNDFCKRAQSHFKLSSIESLCAKVNYVNF